MIFLQGIILGIAVAAPVGMMSLLCINKTLLNGKKDGLIAGFGIAFADFVYAIIAVFLYAFIIDFLRIYTPALNIIGSLILILLGLSFVFKSNNDSTGMKAEKSNYVISFLQTFLLTLSNPTTIISFMVIAASLAITDSWLLPFGIFVGSMVWWTALVTTISFLRHKISKKIIRMINIVSGLIILILGLVHLIL